MNVANKTPLIGLLLAGGRSSRMGTDKACLIHPDGRTLARRTYDMLLEAGCDSAIVSLRSDQKIPAGFEDLPDLPIARDRAGESNGPLSGLLSTMRLHPGAEWIVLACDLPRLSQETLANLISSRIPEETFLSYRSEYDSLPEPLCALYGRGALPVLERAEADGIRCPRKVLIRHNCRLLDPGSPRALENANTPGDWARAIIG